MDNNESQHILGPTSEPDAARAIDVKDNARETRADVTTDHKEEAKVVDEDNKVEGPVFDLSKRLPCKWSTGAGPRIGCVRDYPGHLQSRALEQVNLSPRPGSGHSACYGPIPSPRPSPIVRVSPRLAYMGLPSPRTPIPAAS